MDIKRWKTKKEFKVFEFPGANCFNNVQSGRSIKDFAKACMNFGLERKWPVYLSTKIRF